MPARTKKVTATGKQIALLRGINVGKAKRIAMADLRDLVAELGYGDVKTLLNSGNVVYSGADAPDEAAARIEKAILQQTGVSSKVTVVTAAELAEAIAGNPFVGIATDPSRMLVAFIREPADRKKLEPLTKQDWADERFALGQRVAYLWCPKGVLESRLPEMLQKLVGDGATTRNWSTVLKLQALAEAQD